MLAAGRTRIRRRLPELISGRDVEGKQPASLAGTSPSADSYVGERNVIVLTIRCPTPLDASESASMADAMGPQLFSVIIRIDRMDFARFLAEHQHAFSIFQFHKNRRIANVVIGASVFRTVRIAAAATDVIGVSTLGSSASPTALSRFPC